MMLTGQEIQSLRAVFNVRSPEVTPSRLYVSLEKLMKSDRLYPKQLLKEWIEDKYIQDDKAKHGENDAKEVAKITTELQSFQTRYEALLLENRKVVKEEATKESIAKEAKLRLDIRRCEDEILSREKVLQYKEHWFDRRLDSSLNEKADRKAVQQLTDHKIIERYGMGGARRAWIDDYCAGGVEKWHEQFMPKEEEPEKQKLSIEESVKLKIPKTFRLTHCLVVTIYELIKLLHTGEKTLFLLNGKEQPASFVFKPPTEADILPQQDEEIAQDETELEEIYLQKINAQLQDAINVLTYLEPKISQLLQLSTDMKKEMHVGLLPAQRKELGAFINTLKEFPCWSIQTRSALAGIIPKLDNYFSEASADQDKNQTRLTVDSLLSPELPMQDNTVSPKRHLLQLGQFARGNFRKDAANSATAKNDTPTRYRSMVSGNPEDSSQARKPPIAGPMALFGDAALALPSSPSSGGPVRLQAAPFSPSSGVPRSPSSLLEPTNLTPDASNLSSSPPGSLGRRKSIRAVNGISPSNLFSPNAVAATDAVPSMVKSPSLPSSASTPESVPKP
jgi:hypothetical protein